MGGEWQNVLIQSAQEKRAMLFYSLGKCLAQLEPASLLGLELSGVPAMLLLDRAENDKAYQKAVKAENDKVDWRMRAESAYGTAALLSLRGVSTVVLNRGPIGFESNQGCFQQLGQVKELAKKAKGLSMAAIVRHIATGVHHPQLAPLLTTKKDKKGDKKKKAEEDAPAEGEAAKGEEEPERVPQGQKETGI